MMPGRRGSPTALSDAEVGRGRDRAAGRTGQAVGPPWLGSVGGGTDARLTGSPPAAGQGAREPALRPAGWAHPAPAAPVPPHVQPLRPDRDPRVQASWARAQILCVPGSRPLHGLRVVTTQLGRATAAGPVRQGIPPPGPAGEWPAGGGPIRAQGHRNPRCRPAPACQADASQVPWPPLGRRRLPQPSPARGRARDDRVAPQDVHHDGMREDP